MLGRRLAEHLLPVLGNIQQTQRQRKQDGIAAEERTRSQSRQAEMDRIALEDRTRNQQRQTEQDEIQRMALMSAFSRDGIVPEGERETLSGTLPAMGRIGETPRPGTSVNTGLVDPSRYSQVGTVGGQNFYRDKAQQIAQQREAERKARQDELYKMALTRDANARADNYGQRGSDDVNWTTVETKDGFVQVNPRTGAKRPLGLQAPPKETKPSEPSEGERKAGGMLKRVRGVAETLNKFDSRKTLDEIAARAGMMGNWASSPDGRILRTAGRIWATSVLRPESGATITDQELDAYFDMYLPRPGDDDATLDFKREQRRIAEEGVEMQAGRAVKPAAVPAPVAPDSPPASALDPAHWLTNRRRGQP